MKEIFYGFLVILILMTFIYLNNREDQIKEHGLKSVIEEIWEGQSHE